MGLVSQRMIYLSFLMNFSEVRTRGAYQAVVWV